MTMTSSEEEPDLDHLPLIGRNVAVGDRAARDEPRSKWELLLLTVPFFSLQLTWSIQQVFGIPYLTSLGIPDTQIPLLVISGPVAGIIVPPIVVALSETIESPLGKRKPFIFAGGCGAILSFFFLSAAEPIASSLCYAFSGSYSREKAATATHVIAGLSIYTLNFFIQPLALGLRASVVDYFGPSQQSDANLWIGRFSSAGSIFVALFGLGYSPDFWVLCVAVNTFIGIMLVVVALTKNPNSLGHEAPADKLNQVTTRAQFVKILNRARQLPPITRWTCKVQLISWVAWFFVLNYTSVLVSRLYDKPEVSKEGAEASMTVDSRKAVAGVALLFHTVSLVALVAVSGAWEGPSSASPKGGAEEPAITDDSDSATDVAESGAWNRGSHLSDTDNEGDGVALEISEADIFQRRNLLARKVWRPALLALATSVVGVTTLVAVAPRASASIIIASILLGANGALFGLSNWVPYSLIAYEAAARARSRPVHRVQAETEAPSIGWRENFDANSGFGGGRVGEDSDAEHSDDTPTLLAVHQMAITIPQVVAGLVSSLIMKVLEALGIQQGVWCIYALSVPAAIWAACL
ncbi:hypothetical protein F4861DRAFT_198774 [Xylaria intraflava]|nr:hypothetical protein F4861DRAFT_198774 [Xylaria intraflava]